MPKDPMDYQNGVIYKIVSSDITIKDCYVGSTTNFTKRKQRHKESCNSENRKDYKYKVYKFIRDNGGWDAWDMILIEKYPCSSKIELESRERKYIEDLAATLNSRVPTRTDHEYYMANKDKRSAEGKIFRENNKELLQERTKKYREKHKEVIKARKSFLLQCECGTQYTHAHASRHRKSKTHQRFLERQEPEEGEVELL